MNQTETIDVMRLAVAKERETNRMRIQFNRMRSWLKVVDRCVSTSEVETRAERIYQSWAEAVVTYVRCATAAVFQIDHDRILRICESGRTCGKSDVYDFDATAVVLETGGCTVGAESVPFSRELRLYKAAWFRFDDGGDLPVLLIVGFDERSARFVDGFAEDGVEHLRMTGHNVRALAARARTMQALLEEHENLGQLYRELTSRDQELSQRNGQLTRRTEELQDTLAQLHRAQAELLHRERLSAVGQLAAGVAHEVNNPASFVLSNLEELSTFLEDPGPSLPRDALLSLARGAREGLEHIVGIIGELGMFSRAGAHQSHEMPVSELVGVVQRLTMSHAKHRVSLRFECKVPQALVFGSRRKLSQVLVNLVMNAIQAQGEEGDEAGHHVEVSVFDAGKNIRFEVRDDGPGIPDAIRSQIFEPFFTTKSGFGGSGLGLSIARDIAHEHGGQLWLANEPRAGACFVLEIPKVLASRPVAGVPRRCDYKPRVLLVDDDHRVLRAHLRKLQSEFVVRGAEGSEEGAKILEDDHGFDAVLCDLMMPGLNGIDLWRLVSERVPAYRHRFVFMTGGISRVDLRRQIDQGGFSVARKPISIPEVTAMVAQIIALHEPSVPLHDAAETAQR